VRIDGRSSRRTPNVIEPLELWDGLLPEGYWGKVKASFSERPGGTFAEHRLGEMETDGVSAEVLYPSWAMQLFTLEPPQLQHDCFVRYNDWLAAYCAVAPDRLIGIGQLATHDIDRAVTEAERCKSIGLRGVQIWQSPPKDLAFNSGHYEPLWAACAGLGLSVNLHILTGYGYPEEIYNLGGAALAKLGDYQFKVSINQKLLTIQDALTEIIFSDALDRYRDLRLVVVENEVGWLPFFVDQLDYYYARHKERNVATLERPPSQIFTDQIYATFFRDPNADMVAQRVANVMWSSDYPHGNSTWPHSQDVIEERLGALDPALVERVVRGTVADLFDIGLPELVR
jgi:predicted TIM-barrel fold metal-dependent hydrolase